MGLTRQNIWLIIFISGIILLILLGTFGAAREYIWKKKTFKRDSLSNKVLEKSHMANLTVTPAHDAVILETDKLSYELNEPIYITAAYLYNGSALTGLSFFAEIQRPDTSFNIPLYDDGTHGDSQANDGIYSNIFTDTSVEGGYMVKVFVSGTINGVPIEKENSLPNSILVTKTEVKK